MSRSSSQITTQIICRKQWKEIAVILYGMLQFLLALDSCMKLTRTSPQKWDNMRAMNSFTYLITYGTCLCCPDLWLHIALCFHSYLYAFFIKKLGSRIIIFKILINLLKFEINSQFPLAPIAFKSHTATFLYSLVQLGTASAYEIFQSGRVTNH